MDPKIKKDFDYSKPEFIIASTEEDKKYGIDFWLCGLPVAYRKRRKNYDDITIRYKRTSGAETEYTKILNGDFRAVIFIYDFPDKVILCSTASIKKALERRAFRVIENKDEKTTLAVIKLIHVKHIVWNKSNRPYVSSSSLSLKNR